MTTHPFDALRAPRNARDAHAAMTDTAEKREASQADLRHLHRRAQASPDWRQGRGPEQPQAALGKRGAWWLVVGTLAFWIVIGWLA